MTSKPNPSIIELDLPKPSPTAQAVEHVPSVEGGISALASAGAPFVFFDTVEFCLSNAGIGGVTLSAGRQIAHLPGRGVASDRVIVANIRGSIAAMMALRDTLNEVERMANEQIAAALAAKGSDAPPSSSLPH